MVFDNGDAKVAAATEFVQWLTQPEQDARLGRRGRQPAAAQGDRRAARVAATTSRSVEGLQVFVDVLEDARVRPVIEAYPQVSEAIGQAIVGVLLGQAGAAGGAEAAPWTRATRRCRRLTPR